MFGLLLFNLCMNTLNKRAYSVVLQLFYCLYHVVIIAILGVFMFSGYLLLLYNYHWYSIWCSYCLMCICDILIYITDYWLLMKQNRRRHVPQLQESTVQLCQMPSCDQLDNEHQWMPKQSTTHNTQNIVNLKTLLTQSVFRLNFKKWFFSDSVGKYSMTISDVKTMVLSNF